jgi:hypothetical protein
MTSEQVAEFGLDNLVEIVLTFVVAGIAIAYGTSIQSDVRDEFVTNTWGCGLNATNGTGAGTLYTGCGSAWNASNSAMKANDSIADKMPTLAKIMIAAMILTVLVTYMWMRKA